MSNKVTLEIETAEDYKNVAEGNLNRLRAKVLPYVVGATLTGIIITATVLIMKIIEAFEIFAKAGGG